MENINIEFEEAVFIYYAMNDFFINRLNLVNKTILNKVKEVAEVIDCINTNLMLDQLWYINSDVACWMIYGLKQDDNLDFNSDILGLSMSLIFNDLEHNAIDLQLIKDSIVLKSGNDYELTKIVVQVLSSFYKTLPKYKFLSKRKGIFYIQNLPYYFYAPRGRIIKQEPNINKLLSDFVTLLHNYSEWEKTPEAKKIVSNYKHKVGVAKSKDGKTANRILLQFVRLEAIYNVMMELNKQNQLLNTPKHEICLLAWKNEHEYCQTKTTESYQYLKNKYQYRDFNEYIDVLKHRGQLFVNKDYIDIMEQIDLALIAHNKYDIANMSAQELSMALSNENWLDNNAHLIRPSVSLANQKAQICINNIWHDIEVQNSIPELQILFNYFLDSIESNSICNP